MNVAIGDKPGVADFPLDHGGAGSLNQKYLALIKNKEFGGRKGRYGRVKVDTLANIVEQYVPEGQEIHFCKIDTEGYEEKCLLGMDWNNYRPWIFCIESVLQEEHATNRTDLKWEYLLKENGYTAALMDLNNKYYVANEHKELVKELLPRWYLFQLYDCYRPDRLGTYTMAPEDCYFWEEEKGQPINTADSPCP